MFPLCVRVCASVPLCHVLSPRSALLPPSLCVCVCVQRDPAAFTEYLHTYRNTICGRHPISVLLQVRVKAKK